VDRLVSVVQNNPSYQRILLPSRQDSQESGSRNLGKETALREIFRVVFPSETTINTNRIKSKVRWLLKIYYDERKKLALTGSGTLLRDMDQSDPVSTWLHCVDSNL
jgi:hypothetical protein